MAHFRSLRVTALSLTVVSAIRMQIRSQEGAPFRPDRVLGLGAGSEVFSRKGVVLQPVVFVFLKA